MRKVATETTTIPTKTEIKVTCWAFVNDDTFQECGAPAVAWVTSGFPSFTWPMCQRHVDERLTAGERIKIEPLDTNEN